MIRRAGRIIIEEAGELSDKREPIVLQQVTDGANRVRPINRRWWSAAPGCSCLPCALDSQASSRPLSRPVSPCTFGRARAEFLARRREEVAQCPLAQLVAFGKEEERKRTKLRDKRSLNLNSSRLDQKEFAGSFRLAEPRAAGERRGRGGGGEARRGTSGICGLVMKFASPRRELENKWLCRRSLRGPERERDGLAQ